MARITLMIWMSLRVSEMKLKQVVRILFLFFLIAVVTVEAGDQPGRSGLVFSGKHSRYLGTPENPERIRQSETTSMLLIPEEGVDLGPEYVFEFDFSIWFPRNFSNIFELKNRVYTLTLRSLFHPDSANIHLQMRINGRHLLFSFVRPIGEFTEAIPYLFKMKVDEEKGFIEVRLNGEVKRATSNYLKRGDRSTIRFGLWAGEPECAAIILRYISLKKGEKVAHHWKLDEITGNVAFDSVSDMHAQLENPGWVVAMHYHWTRVFKPSDPSYRNVTSFYRLNTFNRKAVIEEKPSGKPLGNVIPLEADSMEIESVLVDTVLNRLYVTLAVYEKDKCVFHTFFIDTPALSDKEYTRLVAAMPVVAAEKQFGILLLAGSVILLLVIPGMIWLIISKRHRKPTAQPKARASAVVDPNTDPAMTNMISVFGGLKIYDAAGKDLHFELPPKAQEFLCAVIYFTSLDENDSVQVKKLDGKLWPGFDKVKIKNNRNVTNSKVRKTIEKLGSSSIETNGERITLHLDPAVFNEMKEFGSLLTVFNVKAKIEIDHLIEKFISIIRRGALFQGLSSQWIEEERFRIAGRIVEILLLRCEYLYKKEDYNSCEETARLVDLFEPANDQAYQYRIKSLYYLGRHTLVDEVWNTFLEEYKQYSGKEYPGTIKSILKD